MPEAHAHPRTQQFPPPLAAEKAAIILATIGLLGYSGIYLYYLWRATRDHRRLPYAQFRLTFLYLRMHVRGGGEGMNTRQGLTLMGCKYQGRLRIGYAGLASA